MGKKINEAIMDIFDQITKALCSHRYAYKESVTLCGQRVAVHVCALCRNKKYYSYTSKEQ